MTANEMSAAKAYLEPSAADVRSCFSHVCNSTFVSGNLVYSAVVKEIEFRPLVDDPTVNADATILKQGDGLKRVIRLYGGAVRFSRIASLAAAAQLNRADGTSKRFLRVLRPSDCSRLDDEAAADLMVRAGLLDCLKSEAVMTKARAISEGMLIGIVAHEVGHQAYSHTLGSSDSLEVSRNQEREADLFASSIIAASPFGGDILIGTLFWFHALACKEDGREATSHPLSKERFGNFVRDHAEKAKMMGITVQ